MRRGAGRRQGLAGLRNRRPEDPRLRRHRLRQPGDDLRESSAQAPLVDGTQSLAAALVGGSICSSRRRWRASGSPWRPFPLASSEPRWPGRWPSLCSWTSPRSRCSGVCGLLSPGRRRRQRLWRFAKGPRDGVRKRAARSDPVGRHMSCSASFAEVFHEGKSKRSGPDRAQRRSGQEQARISTSSLPSKLQQRARENPLAALVAVGTVGFALGNLVGSRLGRLALAVSVPIVVNRLLDGTLSRDLMRWVTGIPDAPPT